ncbi:MAG: tetratricopeptide repeat protein [Acidobacteria bacterium]|nr:tetratricopeptide repeat protein [Acidobacteriota bacterium]
MKWLAAAMLAVPLMAAERVYEIRGQLVPESAASISLHGATTPFHATTLAGPSGRFTFKKIQPGAYTLIVFLPGRGETRKTIDIGPSVADKRGRVELAVRLDESKMTPDRTRVISMRELSIPKQARDAYENASRKLERRDIDAAIAELKRAVEMAPQFAAAWNHLGTIAYQTQRYAEAEGHFRKALEADANTYEPLVNLGGVLVTLERYEEAYNYNLHARSISGGARTPRPPIRWTTSCGTIPIGRRRRRCGRRCRSCAAVRRRRGLF